VLPLIALARSHATANQATATSPLSLKSDATNIAAFNHHPQVQSQNKKNMDNQRPSRTAPFYAVPSRRLISIEHPAVVRNVDKAIDTLKGDAGLKTVRQCMIRAQ
jgi:hypothetical protein